MHSLLYEPLNSESSYTVENLIRGHNYYIRIRAVNIIGN